MHTNCQLIWGVTFGPTTLEHLVYLVLSPYTEYSHKLNHCLQDFRTRTFYRGSAPQPDAATTIILPSDLEAHPCALVENSLVKNPCTLVFCTISPEYKYLVQYLEPYISELWLSTLFFYRLCMYFIILIIITSICFSWLCVVNAPRCGSCCIFLMLYAWWPFFSVQSITNVSVSSSDSDLLVACVSALSAFPLFSPCCCSRNLMRHTLASRSPNTHSDHQ